jgi:hypothetical protein
VVHNTNLLLDDPAYRLFFEQRFRLPIVMARHIADHVRPSLGELPWVSHVVFGEPPVARSGDTATFVVSGNVEYNRRNYASLLDAVGVLQAEGAAVKVRIVGRSNVRDGKPFRAEAERRGLASCFEYSPSDTNHPDFYRLVAESDFSLPLIDTADPLYGQYLRTKLASSVVFAIGLGVPIVAHTELARVYAIDGGGPTYEDGGLADAMRTAIASTGSERAAWREALERQREAILDASLQNLRTAIEAVTRRRAAT